MNHAVPFALALLFFATGSSWGGNTLDPSRPHLNSLESKGRMDWDDYQNDFIISQSAEITDVPAGELIERIRNQHTPSKLPFSLASKPDAIRFSLKDLPPKVSQGDQLKALKLCSKDKCDVKLHLETEVLPLQKAKNRISLYAELLETRIKNYTSQRKLKGYEKRADNQPYAKRALTLTRFMKSKYPKTFQFLMDDFWNKKASKAEPKSDYFRSEVIQMVGERSQPVFRITHNLEFQESGYVNIEFHLYTNHFMDSSLRIFEVFPWPKEPQKSVYIVTDLVEIDELKKSTLIRKLFKSRMEEAIASFRKSEMKALR